MAEVSVNIKALRQGLSQLDGYIGTLERDAAEVDRICAGLRAYSGYANITDSLRAYSSKLKGTAKNFKSYKKTGLEIANVYQQNEGQITNGGKLGLVGASAVVKTSTEKLINGVKWTDWKTGLKALKIGDNVIEGACTTIGEHFKNKLTGKLKWNLLKGEAEAEVKDEFNAELLKGSVSGEKGIASGNAAYKVGAVAATGTLGATLFKDGKLDPSLNAKVEAKAVAAEGEAHGKIGNDKVNVHGDASGSVLGARAEAQASISKDGIKAKAGAEAYLAEGKVSGGIKIFGIKLDVGVTGKAGGVGASAGGEVSSTAAKGSVGLGLGLGVGLDFSVDWSGFKLW